MRRPSPEVKTYKKGAHPSYIPLSVAQLQDFHSIHLVFTMMLTKPLVSLIMAFAAASGVAGSVTSVRRGNGGYPPPNLPPVSQCNTGPVQCCNTLTSTKNPLTAILSGLLPVGTFIDPNLAVGLTCFSLVGGTSCSSTAVCCTGVSQTGLINVGCTPINFGL
ncbi:hydrophobin-domain-containing protein [Russula earlei]|uniref:Hydrophobin-domain-containing protein n=1 Tax=Russula earlei TaxID=71964 RepID=A0ACC0U5B2_9AGAM|nr:hydrophobin-domain-containing protein [Russula earlei]